MRFQRLQIVKAALREYVYLHTHHGDWLMTFDSVEIGILKLAAVYNRHTT